jgi:hypothetical protein
MLNRTIKTIQPLDFTRFREAVNAKSRNTFCQATSSLAIVGPGLAQAGSKAFAKG